MAERTRKQAVYFMVSEEEREQIEERMKQAGIRNMRAYLLKMALNGYILQLDMTSIQKFVSLLSSSANNLNQIAKRANETRNIYEADIVDLQERYEKLWEAVGVVLKEFTEMENL